MTENETRSLSGCNHLTSRDGMKTVKISRVCSWEIHEVTNQYPNPEWDEENPYDPAPSLMVREWEIRAYLSGNWFIPVAAFPSPEIAIEAKRQMILFLNNKDADRIDFDLIERVMGQ